MKNSEDKVTIHYEDLMDYYDLYVNGLNCVASGTLYLTGDAGLLTSLDPILVNGIDSGEVGMQYDFDVISDYCIRVNDFQPLGQGELDFIYVDNGYLYKLSGMYNYGYHKINITVSDGFGVIPIADIENIEATDIYIADGEQYTDPWVAYDGDESTNVRYGYNANNAYLTFTFTEARPVSAVRFLGYPPSETFKFWVEYSSDKNIWTKVANGDKAYSRRNWGNEWFPYNFGEEVTAKYFRIAMNTFVVPVYGYEVELYGSSLSIEEEPVEVFETNYVLPTSPGVGYTGSNAYDGNVATGVPYGYLDINKVIKIYAKQRAKIGKIRTYHSRLDSADWIKIRVYDSYLNSDSTEVVPQTSHTNVWQGQWREFDISDQQIYGVMIEITTGTGFVTSDVLAEIEVDPW